MPANPSIHISPAAAITGLIMAVGLAWVLLTSHLGHGGHHHEQDGTPDWSVPALDAYADGKSLFHCWDVRVKLASLLAFCFFIVSLQTLIWAGVALLLALAALLLCRIPLTRAMARLLAMAGFLAMFLVVLPLTAPLQPTETLIYLPLLDQLPIHGHALLLAATIICKACTVALLMEPMLATAPLPVTLEALRRLGLPSTLGQMLLLSHRYIFVFLHEIKRMYRGMRVRGFSPGTNLETVRTMGNFFGMLFVRSFDRTQRVYDAMLSRGYTGSFPTFTTFSATGADWGKGIFFVLLGLGLVLLDHFVRLDMF